jgi:hypothetical protein
MAPKQSLETTPSISPTVKRVRTKTSPIVKRSYRAHFETLCTLQKFPNLRYRCGQRDGNPRDPQNATRVTGVVEYPFNDNHPFMQETSGSSNDVDLKADEDVASDSDTEHEDQSDAVIIKGEQTSSHDNEDSSTLTARQSSTHLVPDTSRPEQTLRSSSTPSEHTADQESSYDEHSDSMSLQHDWSSQPIFRAPSPKAALISPSQATKSTTKNGKISTPIKSPYFARARKQNILELPRRKLQTYKDITIRVPLDGPRWSNAHFNFAVVVSVQTAPKTQVTDLSEHEGMDFQEI